MMYGGHEGYLNSRAQIQLLSTDTTKSFAFLRFCDPNMPFPPDTNVNGIITMHLPSSMFGPVLELLRREMVLTVYWPWGATQAFLFTGNLPIGAPPILPPITDPEPGPIHP
jgi:hypothetical protein